ncbi:family 78 glycoside hydrolase catalytic domain [Luteolibacter yonseiensis]|uniref:alpha-L-rhamnosidase n=1 Tax=Luteolibacter yonseiensis TaxID=1144680 RepID=A0A934R7K2_9BACT|nr:family 78 glycoside hydrolase catalytic domain [Luteolibacter yonseiensis]MBK1816685.1 family 78 glycoside hydrolase catalytic domain [Luteolibacter yonseiensis]
MKLHSNPTSRKVCAALALLANPLLAEVTSTNLRCEYLTDPHGIEVRQPRLSWLVGSLERGEKQTAYQILVASSEELLAKDKGDLWDSGKVGGDATSQIVYQGAALASRSRCFWKVRSWDKGGEPSEWSKPATWSIGLLEQSDWSAKWIDASARVKRDPGLPTPVILKASYEPVQGGGGLDVTEQLTAKATSGGFSVEVGNEGFGNDPAYGKVKHLRVEYDIAGKKSVRFFPEKASMNFPQDLSPPPRILRASYEAADGVGSMDVTAKLAQLAEAGSFTLAVDNGSLGADPAFNRVKKLRVEFSVNGQPVTKSFDENTRLHYPTDLVAPATVPYLRKTFTVDKPVVRATVYATALGIYELNLNGKRVGDHFLAPEWTDFSKRLRYQEYDVTALLAQGRNVLGAQVANGWYSGHIGNGGFQYWGKSPALLAQLELTYADGGKERVVTDHTWKSHVSPLTATDFMLGEDYDATKEIKGWNEPGFDDSGWLPVAERDEPAREMNGQVMEPVRQLSTIKAKTLTEPKADKWTYDLGQNMVGIVRLKITAAAGTKITLRHAEMLNPDGTVYTDNLRGAPSIDTYVCKGKGEEIWQPSFTFHGFRYVELTGVSEKPPLDAVTGVVIASDTPQTGKFVCSDGQVNQLQSNIEWGQRGNYLSVPTDCPQRDERLGWMGDAQVFVRTATYNADVAAFFTKWLVDVTDSQAPNGQFADVAPFAGPSKGTPAWGDAGVICPWTIYQAYGDLQLLARQYPSMVRWVDYSRSGSTGFIRSGNRGSDYGDWLSIGADTDKELIGTGYFAYSTKLVAKAAAALGKTEDAAKYEELFQSIKKAFIAKYVSSDGKVAGETQCAYVMALKFDLLPDELRAKAADHLEADIISKDYHLSTGFVGVSYLLPELTKAGKTATAYRLLHQDTFPSWLFSVKMGATTIWERWDGWTPDKGFQNVIMNSFNHYSLGSCGEWLYGSVAGIDLDPAAPGFKRIIIKPVPGGKLTEASGELKTIHGLVTSAWSSANGTFTLTTAIPTNTTATVHVPAKGLDSVLESGKPVDSVEGVKFLRMENGAAVFSVESGRYQFTSGKGVVSGTDKISRPATGDVKILVSTLLANDGKGSVFRSAAPLSINGAAITVRDGSLHYQPPPGNTGPDVFTYTIQTPQGGVATHTVQMAVAQERATAQAME